MRKSLLLMMGCLMSGCFIEGVAGYAPGIHETVTPAGGTAMDAKSAATTLSIFVGFYLDVGYLQISYAFPAAGGSVVNLKDETAAASGIGTTTNHLRFDVDGVYLADLPDSALILRGTLGLDFVSGSSLKMAPSTDFQKSGDASGYALFAGGTLAWRNHLSLSGGIAYTSVSAAAGDAVAAIDASGMSFQLRATYQWFPRFIVTTARHWPGGITPYRQGPAPHVCTPHDTKYGDRWVHSCD